MVSESELAMPAGMVAAGEMDSRRSHAAILTNATPSRGGAPGPSPTVSTAGSVDRAVMADRAAAAVARFKTMRAFTIMAY